MKKAEIRIWAVALALVLALGWCYALADNEAWTCPACSQEGNTGNFCSNCGTARPSGTWECDQCGETGNTGNFCTNCGAAKPDGNAAAPAVEQAVNEWQEQIPGEEAKVKVCLQGVEASGYVDNNGKWVPEHAVDGDQSTCWQVSDRKGLKGKIWIQLNTGGEQAVDEIWFKNGFWGHNTEGIDQYYINSRPKKIKIEFRYSGESSFRDAFTHTLKDEVFTDWQRVSLDTQHKNVAAVRIWVESKYTATNKAGKKYPHDICLSEVMLVKHAPAAGAKPAPEEKAETLYESNPAVTGAKLNQKIATREGPGTNYAETHTYFSKDWDEQRLPVLKKAYNKKNGAWWVQLEFSYQGKLRRLWTGAKRVDVNLDKVKELKKKGLVHVEPTKAYSGPGKKYWQLKDILFAEDEIEWFDKQNGFVEIDFYDVNREIQRHCWVPESAVSNWH